uniref:Uncharacterized protein n=1 Tax=Arundo donax TaxID=35708 RepID=A0A0A9CP68_ARUDO
MASPLGSYILNVRVAGRFYDAEADRKRVAGAGGGGRDRVCLGVECFKRSFLIITAATVLGALVSLVLVWRTWGFYKGDIYARFRESGAGEEGTDGGLPVDHQRRRPEGEEEEEESTAANGRKG